MDSKTAAGSEEDEATLAESIVDSMHSCADTFRTAATDEEQTLHSCADTLEGDPDNDSLRDFESPTPPASVGKTGFTLEHLALGLSLDKCHQTSQIFKKTEQICPVDVISFLSFFSEGKWAFLILHLQPLKKLSQN